MATVKEYTATQEAAMHKNNNAASAESQRPAAYEPGSHRDQEGHVTAKSPTSPADDILERMLARAGRLASEMRSVSKSSSCSVPVSSIELHSRDTLTECSSIGAAFAMSTSVLMDRLPELHSPETEVSREDDEEGNSVLNSASEATDKPTKASEAIKPSNHSTSTVPSNTTTTTSIPQHHDNFTPPHDVKPSAQETPLQSTAPPALTPTSEISPKVKHVATTRPISPEDDILERTLARAGRLASEMRSISKSSSCSVPVSSIELHLRDALTECSSIGAAFAASTSTNEVSQGQDAVKGSVVDSAVDATDKVAQALEAIKPSTRSSSIMTPSNTATSTPPQNDNITPLHSEVKPSVLETPLDDTAPPSLTATPDISPTTKGTILEVEVADYTKHFTAAQAMSPVCHDNVQWEKVTLATQTDDDYVPMADYSHVKPNFFFLSAFTNSKMSKNICETPYQLLLRKHRNARRRRQRRLALAGVLMLLCCGVSYYLLQDDVLSTSFTDTIGRLRDAAEGDGEQIIDTGTETKQNDIGIVTERNDGGTNEMVERDNQDQPAVEVAIKSDIHVLPFCELPLASRWSPICDDRSAKQDSGRLERLIITEDLLAVMM